MNRGLLGYPLAGRNRQILRLPEGQLLAPKPSVVQMIASSDIAVAAPVGTNSLGSWVVLGTFPANGDGFFIEISWPNAICDVLLDLAIGPTGGEVVVVPTILSNGGGGNIANMTSCYIPLPVRGGDQLSARCQSTDASVTPRVEGLAMASGGIYSAMRCKKATTYGAATADSGGVSVDPGGSGGVKGAWTELAAATTDRIDYLLYCIGGQNNAARSNTRHIFDLGYGPVGGEKVVVEGMGATQDAALDSISPAIFSRWAYIPAGQRLVARQSCGTTDATDRLADVVVVGFTA